MGTDRPLLFKSRAHPRAGRAARLLLECHRHITQAKAPNYFGFNLAAVLTVQADSLGDPALAVTFFEKLLTIHFSEAATGNRIFGDVLKPWARVMLAGEAEITGIIAVNRYEYKPDQEEFQWAAPFKVLVSSDGKAWTEVATCDKAKAVMRIDLTGKAPRARYVRLERQAPAAAGKPPGRFHLRNFLVYGRKLY